MNAEVGTVIWPDGSYTHLPNDRFGVEPADHSVIFVASGLLWVTTFEEPETRAYDWIDIERLRRS